MRSRQEAEALHRRELGPNESVTPCSNQQIIPALQPASSTPCCQASRKISSKPCVLQIARAFAVFPPVTRMTSWSSVSSSVPRAARGRSAGASSRHARVAARTTRPSGSGPPSRRSGRRASRLPGARSEHVVEQRLVRGPAHRQRSSAQAQRRVLQGICERILASPQRYVYDFDEPSDGRP